VVFAVLTKPLVAVTIPDALMFVALRFVIVPAVPVRFVMVPFVMVPLVLLKVVEVIIPPFPCDSFGT
jgi:hypothetical protein